MQVQEVIDRINEEIEEVASFYVELKQQGNKYTACCPFHNEKTPSFVVTPSKAMFKCFGCGKGGDAIHFIREIERVEFKEAVEIGAQKLKLDFQWEEQNFNDEDYKHKESLRIVCSKAAEYFRENFLKSDIAKKYYSKERGFALYDDDPFMPGYAPAGNHLVAWAKKNAINKNLLIEAGLIKSKDGNEYDFFRDRLMFPICNKTGKVIGFVGRALDPKEKRFKYLNSPDTPIFTKGEVLFGLNVARSAIRNQKRAYLVEGNFDVKRLHQITITNTVAPSGTALTEGQIQLLKTLTNSVTLIYDGDMAGRLATIKNAELLIKHQFHVNVIELPDKEDPDSYFTDLETFDKLNDAQEDYFGYTIRINEKKCNNPHFKSEFIKDVAKLISCYDDKSKQDVYLDYVSVSIKPKKAWQDQLNIMVADKAPVEKKSFIPKHVSLDDFYQWGFYVDNNSYWFNDRTGKEMVTRSNFVMTPLFHIESTINAKRLYEVKNKHKITKVIEIPQKDMVSISAFKVRVESLGNFLWTGGESDLNKLKAWWYEKTKSAKEITQLGWQKEGFFAWGNGIYNGEFRESDQYGIVEHKELYYYIPAGSKVYHAEENLFEFDRKFIYIETNITLKEYVRKFTTVFGDNGKIAMCFYFACLFRDIIVKRFDKFPILNMFGPKGAGKNACAESLLYFFGKKQKAPNLHNTSKAALADHAATSCNALCVFDEYRNDLEMEKREFLKGLWDGTGRSRMNMDKDKRLETSSVDQGVIVCGQQMATADIALLSRFIFIGFVQTVFSKEEEAAYDELSEINHRGISHITHQILRFRDHFKENYHKTYDKLAEKVEKILDGEAIETRTLTNWLMVMAAYATLQEELELSWDYEETLKICIEKMRSQNTETKKNDDLGGFWKIVQFLISSNILLDGGDYKLEYATKIKRNFSEKGKWEKAEIGWIEPKRLLYLSTSRVFNLYERQVLTQGGKPLPDSTVDFYLRNSKPFICDTKKEPFKKVDPKTNTQEERKVTDKDGFETTKKMRTSTSALVFDLDMLELNFATAEEDEGGTLPAVSETPNGVIPASKKKDGQEDLPF